MTLKKQSKNDAIAQLIGLLILAPILMTLLWNYGMTDVIDALGGPDADVNLLQGGLAYLFVSGACAVLRGRA
jgi:hypothetical protein